MKRKVLLIVVASFMIMGIVSAASLWGNYKGYAKVKVNLSGSEYKATGVPPIVFNGQVMLPLNVLKNIGVKYTWDGKKQTVDILNIKNNEKYIIDILKKYTDTSDTYKKLQDYKIDLDKAILSLQLVSILLEQGSNNNIVKQFTDYKSNFTFLESRLNEISNLSSNNIKYTGGFVFDAPSYDSILTNYSYTLSDIKNAYNYLLKYGSENKIEDYNLFLLSIDMANKDSNNAANDSFKGYEVYKNLTMNYR